MFTGLVRAIGVVVGVDDTAFGRRIRISASGWGHRAEAGESICVSGCCLTLAEEIGADGVMAFDVVAETLRRTTLGEWGVGQRVNLEACCTPSTLLGGHIVQGHVDGVGEVLRAGREEWAKRCSAPGDSPHDESRAAGEGARGGAWEYVVRVRVGRELMEYVTPKGSVCVDGVSLTIAGLDVREGWFEVALIPTTLRETTLADVGAGSRVNVEMDVLSKTIVHWARNWGGAR